MFNNKEELKVLSRAITHLVYRNTEVEDFHSESVIMDEKFYYTVIKIVVNKLKLVTKFYNQLMSVSEDDITRTISGQQSDLDNSFLRFLGELFFNCQFGTHWDDPVQLEQMPQGELSKYILDGHFRQCCLEHRELDDDTMCFINKDINNRIYTLLVKGYFNQKI